MRSPISTSYLATIGLPRHSIYHNISFVVSSRSHSRVNFFIPQNDWTNWCHDDSEKSFVFRVIFCCCLLITEPLLINNKLFY